MAKQTFTTATTRAQALSGINANFSEVYDGLTQKLSADGDGTDLTFTDVPSTLKNYLDGLYMGVNDGQAVLAAITGQGGQTVTVNTADANGWTLVFSQGVIITATPNA